jgi:hypothetical protein
MSRRSVTNDRYRVDRSGKTRKSASAAKPKRAAGESASAPKKKPAAKPRSALGRLFGGGSSSPAARIESTPEMKKLRRVWWVFMGVAILLALTMLQTSKLKNRTIDAVVFGTYAAALGGALYIEFVPLRRARLAAATAAKGGKGAKGPKDEPADKGGKTRKGGDAPA